jgi:hypothetical protein
MTIVRDVRTGPGRDDGGGWGIPLPSAILTSRVAYLVKVVPHVGAPP